MKLTFFLKVYDKVQISILFKTFYILNFNFFCHFHRVKNNFNFNLIL